MAAIKSFRDLVVYQRARAEAGEIFRLSRKFPVEEKYSLTDQIRRSSRAVNAMLAEAWSRRRYEAAFINKVNEALGEAMETQAWLDHALDNQYITPVAFDRCDTAWQEIGGMLQRMIDKAETFCRKPQE
jgi:four helix bundle protein